MEVPSTSSTINVCEVCKERIRLYTCPRCGIGYCGSDCYKSFSHIDCSESFYKQCVEEELKSQEHEPALKQKMVDILKRIHETDVDDILQEDTYEEDSPLDSDDEEELPDLEIRLQNINLDDPVELWSVLSSAERQKFEALLKNGEAEKLLPVWIPWWIHNVEKKLIHAIDEDIPNDTKYPALVDVPLFNELQKASPCVRFNVMNVIYAYAYIAIYYNGDYLNCAENAANIFLLICENMKNNKNFEDTDAAIDSIIENIESIEWLPQDERTLIALKEAGISIIKGPDTAMKTIYISAALSELHRLFIAAKEEISTQKNGSNQGFMKRFSYKHSNNIKLSKKTILLCLKKLEYYLSWSKTATQN